MRRQRQRAAGVVSGEAHIAVRQRHHLRPRCRARCQQDERVVVAARGAAVVCRPNRRSDKRAAAEIVLRPRHEIDHSDIERFRDVTARRVRISPGDQRRQLQFAEIALQLVRRQVGIDGNAGAARGDRDQGQCAVGATRQRNRNPVGRDYAEPAQRTDEILRPVANRAVVEGRPARGEEGGRRRRLAGMENEKAADIREYLRFGRYAG
ncbi:ribosomal protein S30 [Bradyrhizobium sp. LM3.4]